VTLKIYNLLGSEVATLVDNEQKVAGYHAAVWDGRDKAGRVVASGVYVYRLQAGSFSSTKKLALVK
jgi:flagellar hook assembly protein FlgD